MRAAQYRFPKMHFSEVDRARNAEWEKIQIDFNLNGKPNRNGGTRVKGVDGGSQRKRDECAKRKKYVHSELRKKQRRRRQIGSFRIQDARCDARARWRLEDEVVANEIARKNNNFIFFVFCVHEWTNQRRTYGWLFRAVSSYRHFEYRAFSAHRIAFNNSE